MVRTDNLGRQKNAYGYYNDEPTSLHIIGSGPIRTLSLAYDRQKHRVSRSYTPSYHSPTSVRSIIWSGRDESTDMAPSHVNIQFSIEHSF